MPYNRSNNNRSSGRYERDDRRDSGRRNGGRQQDARARKFSNDRFNMLDFGKVFMDEVNGQKYDFKLRLMLKTKDGEQVNVFDGDGRGDNEYTPEEAAMLLAKALLEGRAINICLFEQDYGSWTGNARIDISDIENTKEEKPKQHKKTQRQVTYVVPEEEEEFTEEDASDSEDSDLPY